MKLINSLSEYVLPLILLLFALILLLSKKNLADSFIKGASDGIKSCVNLLPTLVLIMCGVSVLFSSGAVDILCDLFSPVFSALGVPDEILPSIILRPFSGSGVTAVADRLFKESGPDSIASKIACILMGSTDTIIYTLSMYFSAAKIKRTRYALPASFIVLIFSVFVSTYIGRIFL